MGWERKRGKLAEFNHYLRGGARDAFSRIVGDTKSLRDVKLVITLDSDTVLPPDAAQLLVGAMAHPLNRPVFDAERGLITKGTGSCSRAWVFRSRAPIDRGSRRSTPDTRASIRTRPPCRTYTRICSARARTPGRASTTWRPSSARRRAGSPRTCYSAMT